MLKFILQGERAKHEAEIVEKQKSIRWISIFWSEKIKKYFNEN